MNSRLVLGACIGECIHVGGILGFLRLAESLGYRTSFLGPAVSLDRLLAALAEQRPAIAALSYRLSPEVAGRLFEELREELARKEIRGVRFFFGGTPPVADKAAASGIFEAVFSGGEAREALVAYLTGKEEKERPDDLPPTLVERILRQEPYPLLRHHLGLDTVERTVGAAEEIAESGQLGVVSIAPDQNAQQFFFRPSEMPKSGHGAGGVPVRTADDMRSIYAATRRGNHPLLRCYAGTRDLVKWAEMSVETIDQAWGAVPIFWYSELDGRSDRRLEEAIAENRSTIAWYAERGVPVEVNDAHQWSLRGAHDAVAVAASYIATDADTSLIPTVAPADIPDTPTPLPPTNTPRPIPTDTPIPGPTPTPRPVCDCGGDIYNCKSFSSWRQAQACYNYCVSIGKGDIHKLDGDNDGTACESMR